MDVVVSSQVCLAAKPCSAGIVGADNSFFALCSKLQSIIRIRFCYLVRLGCGMRQNTCKWTLGMFDGQPRIRIFGFYIHVLRNGLRI